MFGIRSKSMSSKNFNKFQLKFEKKVCNFQLMLDNLKSQNRKLINEIITMAIQENEKYRANIVDAIYQQVFKVCIFFFFDFLFP